MPEFHLAPLRLELFYTLVAVALFAGAHFAIGWLLRRESTMSREQKLRAAVFWRHASFLIAVLVFAFIWREELRVAALSLAAMAVALVIAGKEILTSVLGYVYRTTSGTFRFGDVIEINNVRGEVINQTLLATTVLEVGDEHQFTGRVVQFPNSFYVMHPLKNLSRVGRYQLGILTVPVAAAGDVEGAKHALEEAARGATAEFVVPAAAALRALEGAHFVAAPSTEPRVALRMSGINEVQLVLRYSYPAGRRMATEQDILCRYLARAPKPPCYYLPGSAHAPGLS